ncbi:hypothetical protein NEFER03_1179 [Nematocida sp. LUAm3]|nr:hypothetical protein NEFER03_1179 [Nematocida sp. LUAm3]KAI5175788.1 hypothetical protein NEFER02_1657 [Nematocida sp. LUAm2]KAI5178284.1 hypothetical protein NEFER01_1451 [Nematocida sp. LUAm1]
MRGTLLVSKGLIAFICFSLLNADVVRRHTNSIFSPRMGNERAILRHAHANIQIRVVEVFPIEKQLSILNKIYFTFSIIFFILSLLTLICTIIKIHIHISSILN